MLNMFFFKFYSGKILEGEIVRHVLRETLTKASENNFEFLALQSNLHFFLFFFFFNLTFY